MTGLIYVAIIAVWAVVLVPAWLRRHDHLDPERSVDRFTRSMKTLASRPSVLGIPLPEPESTTTHEAPAEVLQVSRPDLAAARERAAAIAARAGAGARPRSATARRRTVLMALVGTLAVVGGLVAGGVLLPVALLAPAALLVGFLGLARHQVRLARAARSTHERRPAADPTRFVPTARGASVNGADQTWEARSAPLPTYVTAPPAPGFPRVIDTAPGAWTAAAMLERAQQEKVRAERMAAAKAEAIARAKAEQAAAEARSRDEEFLTQQAALWGTRSGSSTAHRRRAVNE